MKSLKAVLLGLLLAAGAAGGGFYWWQTQQGQLPDHIASGNGRIEAEEVHIATKYAGRVAEVLVEESQAHLVRRRETLEELTRGETIPPVLEDTTNTRD